MAPRFRRKANVTPLIEMGGEQQGAVRGREGRRRKTIPALIPISLGSQWAGPFSFRLNLGALQGVEHCS